MLLFPSSANAFWYFLMNLYQNRKALMNIKLRRAQIKVWRLGSESFVVSLQNLDLKMIITAICNPSKEDKPSRAYFVPRMNGKF